MPISRITAQNASVVLRAGAWIALIVVLIGVAACGGGPPESTSQGEPGSPGTAPAVSGAPAVPADASLSPVDATGAPALEMPAPDPATVVAARVIIESAVLDDPGTIDAIAAARFDEGAPEAAAQALADGVTGDARWAAVWVYASSGWDSAVLRPVLEDADPTIRVLAASALAAWGDPAGIPALVGLAGGADQLAGSHPPTTTGAFARGMLAQLVDGRAGKAGAKPADAAAWGEWLDQHGGSLRFDPAAGTWSAS